MLGSDVVSTGQPAPHVAQTPAAPAPAAPAAAWWSVLGYAVAIWAGTRVGFIILTHLYDSWFRPPLVPGCSGSCTSPVGIFASWYRWDASLWEGVAFTGYSHPYLTPFYPAYPLLLRIGEIFLGPPHRAAEAIIVTSLCSLAAFAAVAWLAASEFGSATARGTVLLLAAYPVSLFMYAPYSEALSVAFIAAALAGARRRLWWVAAAAALGATLTRPTGLLLVAPIAWEIGRANWSQGRLRVPALRPLAAQLAALAAAPLAILGYMGYLWIKLGHPLIAIRSEHKYWGRTLTSPLGTVERIWYYLPSVLHGSLVGLIYGLDLAALVAFLVLPIVFARRMPFSLTLYSLCVVAVTFLLAAPGNVPGGVDPLLSGARFMLASVPVFLIGGRLLERRPGFAAVLPAAFMLQGALALMFMNWNWVE